MFAAADVCGIDRSLCIPGDLDLYDICCEPDLTDFIYFLSCIMGDYIFSTSCMLLGSDEESEKADGCRCLIGIDKKGAVAKYSDFTIYGSNINDIYAIYCRNLSFCNSPFFLGIIDHLLQNRYHLSYLTKFFEKLPI